MSFAYLEWQVQTALSAGPPPAPPGIFRPEYLMNISSEPLGACLEYPRKD